VRVALPRRAGPGQKPTENPWPPTLGFPRITDALYWLLEEPRATVEKHHGVSTIVPPEVSAFPSISTNADAVYSCKHRFCLTTSELQIE
jgi:hypothetical protein